MQAPFPKRLRLSGKAEFQRVFADPRRSSDRYFTVLACRNEQPYPRLGLAIAKRQVRLSVSRNRIKRIIRECFRRHQCDLPALDLVVMGRSAVSDTHNARLFQSLERHWRRVAKSFAGNNAP